MAEQAILDLPIIEFETLRGSPDALHDHCIRAYGITGGNPSADAAFHLGASLWRYREAETPKQVAGLAASYLNALAERVGAERRLSAERAGTRNISRIRDAEEELDERAHHLAEVTRVVFEFVRDLVDAAHREPERARHRLESNIQAMWDRNWSSEMDEAAHAFSEGKPQVRWTDSLIDTLDALEGAHVQPAAAPPDTKASVLEDRLVEHLEAELTEYRRLAGLASARLIEMDSERRELEIALQDAGKSHTMHSARLDEARRTLESSLQQTRKQLQLLEQDIGPNLRGELERVRADRDRLSDELVKALDAATQIEIAREELLEQIENAASDRVQAADALSSLSTRLDVVQKDAESTAARAQQHKLRIKDLEGQLADARTQAESALQDRDEVLARVAILETTAGRHAEIEQALEAAEERLAKSEREHQDSLGKLDTLTGEFEDALSELENTREALQQNQSDLKGLQQRFAETDALATSRDQRITQMKGEIDRLRGQVAANRTAEGNLRQQLQAAQDKASKATRELEETLRDKEEAERTAAQVQADLAELRELRNQLTAQLRTLEVTAERATQTLQQRDKDTGRLKGELAQAQKRIADLELELQQSREGHRTAAARAEEAEAAAEKAHSDLRNAQESLAGLPAAHTSSQQEAASLREELKAALELGEQRRKQYEEKLSLLQERAQRLENEGRLLAEALARHEKNRAGERAEIEQLSGRATRDTAAVRDKLEAAQRELYDTQERLREAEQQVLSNETEVERAQSRYKHLMDSIGAVADLRTEYEKADESKRAGIASKISRKLDSLFAEAGRPVHADRRTEKILVLHVKKGDDELEGDDSKPFVATKQPPDSNGDAASSNRPE